MAGGIYRGIVVPHAPRLAPGKVPDFGQGLVDGMIAMGEDIRADRPDAIIVNSTHYVSTFNWHACTLARHKGRCVSMEAPDLIGGAPYDYKGDPKLGRAILEEIKAAGAPCVAMDSEDYAWDYGTWVPVQYMDPGAEVPVLIIPVVLAADLDESFDVGRALHRAAVKAGKKVVLAASTSFTHKLVRGPDVWPEEARVERDRAFIQTLLDGRVDAAWAGFEDYARFVVGEMGGRGLALLLGGLVESGAKRFDTAQFGPYGQSSASGNASVSLKAAA